MLLTEMLVNLRVELQDMDSALWVDEELIRAIEKSVSLMSRMLPKRSIIETILVRTITTETLTIASSTGTLAYKPIKADSVAMTGKVMDTDYRVNYLTGVVTEIGSNLPDTDYTVSYELDLQMLDISSLLPDYIKVERLEYPIGTLVTADVFGDFLVFKANITLTENYHLRIIYLGKWTAPTLGTEGDYPSNLDDAIIIGSAGQALIYKAEKYTQLSATTVAAILVTLATMGDLTLAAHGLTAPTPPTLGDPTPPALNTFSAPSAPELPSAPSAPSAPSPDFSAAETALGAIATEITAAKAHHTSGATVINAATRGENVAAIYGDYASAIIRAAEARASEGIARLRQVEDGLAQYASEVASYGSEVNSFANETSGAIGKYREQIESEKVSMAENTAMVAKYEAEIREETLAVNKYETEVRSFQTEAALYQSDVAAYVAKANNLAQEGAQSTIQVRNYLDIAGRYLASGQSKINEMLVMLGLKAEFPMSKAATEQRE